MGVVFLYQGPHLIHRTWAESIRAYPLYYGIVPVNKLLGRLYMKQRYIRGVWRRFTKILLKTLPISINASILLIEGGIIPHAVLLKKRLNAKSILIAADRLFYNVEMILRNLKTGSRNYKKYREYKEFLDSINGVIAVSNMVKNDTIKYFKLIVKKEVPVKVVYPFIDQYKFSKIKPSLKNNNIVFISAHQLTKGVDLLPLIFYYIKREVRDVKLFILSRESEYTKILHAFRKILGYEDFRIIGYAKDIREYLSKSTLLLHPARYDSFGVIVIEAMASGIIPIVTYKTGASEVVRKVSEKLVVKSLEPNIIAERVVEMLNLSYYEKKELSEICRNEALKPIYSKYYSINVFKRSFLDIVDTLLF